MLWRIGHFAVIRHSLSRGSLELGTPRSCSLPVRALELFHERNKRFDARERERVVDRSANAAYRTVSLQAVESRLCSFTYELLFELFARKPERHVHQRTAVSLRVAAIEVA